MEEIKQKWDLERRRLSSKLITTDTESWQSDPAGPRLVGGVDISFVPGDDVRACAGYVVW